MLLDAVFDDLGRMPHLAQVPIDPPRQRIPP
jgi:hypothetical protein